MPHNMIGTFIAVDWGTSSLRLWLMSGDGRILAETRSSEGMGTLSPDDFEGVLRKRILELGPEVKALPRPLTVVLCGMVGARQGWREAPYVDIPASLMSVVDSANPISVDGIDARILPGLARRSPKRPDVMRGEETQLLGLVLDQPDRSGVVCMPGTHSKWVVLENGHVDDFTTAMTGELFAVLAQHSILRMTIGAAAPTGDPESPAFVAGLETALENPALVGARLFALRADGLLFGTDGVATADRLSGLLIGSEVGAALSQLSADPVILVASGRLAGLYSKALTLAGRKVDLVDADEAVRAGLLYAARRLWPIPTSRTAA